MLKTIRVITAAICLAGFVLLFADVSGFAQARLTFLARIQLVPAILAGSLAAVACLLAASLVFGRIYCSSLCPLGGMQDLLARMKPKRRYRFAPGRTWLRSAALALFLLAFAAGVPLIFGLLEPYSAFGRIAADIVAPLWTAGSNGLALAAERMGSFAVGPTAIPQKGVAALTAAIATLAVVGVLAWKGGRIWCNTLCPVGTVLGQINRLALIRLRLDGEKCLRCGMCERVCKAQCIDAEAGRLDSGRCVSCFNCLAACRQNALAWRPFPLHRQATALLAALRSQPHCIRAPWAHGALGRAPLERLRSALAPCLPPSEAEPAHRASRSGLGNTTGKPRAAELQGLTRKAPAHASPAALGAVTRHASHISRRALFATTGLALGAAALPLNALAAARKEAIIPALTRKADPERSVPVLPPGAGGLAAFLRKCTGCQLCVSACPHRVLYSSNIGVRALQAAMRFEHGYCRVNCVVCSSLCPTGAIRPISVTLKSAIQVGRAIVHHDRCIVSTDRVACTACAKTCPAGAISLVGADGTYKRPAVDAERCIGCGACEYVCPARPVSAVIIEGNIEHRIV
ncbi:MAG: 4Fe-4S dicluster domain-containing protein [Desulfovibrio sp.]|jgi:polyferredoxin|nr:4Fe-4S dicluster domain-containing protein [Desulfovibrio sp.]